MVRRTFRTPATPNRRFAPSAADSLVGTTMPVTAGDLTADALVVAARVVDEGTRLEVTLQVDDPVGQALDLADRAGWREFGVTSDGPLTLAPEPAGMRTVYGCPLAGCGWEHESLPAPARRSAASLDDLVRELADARMAADDEAVRTHLDGHTVEEFLETIGQLRAELAAAQEVAR